MGIDDGGLIEAIVEPADDEEEICPSCETFHWLRLIAGYAGGACWVIYCGDCGKMLQKRWNIIP